MADRQRKRQRGRFTPTSYYKGTAHGVDDQIQRSRGSKEKTGLLQKKLGLAFTVVILLIMAGTFYFYGVTSPVTIAVPDGSAELTNNIEKTATEYLQSGLKRFKFALDNEDLSQVINAEFPQVNGVVVQAPLFSRGLTVTGELRVPLAHLERGENSFIIDQHGAIYTDTSVDISNLPKIKDTSAISASDTDYELPRSTILFTRDFNNIVLEKKISDKPITLTVTNQPRELIWRPPNTSYDVKLLANRDPLDQAQEYRQLRDYFLENNIIPREYVDLRVDDTAYYR